MSTSTKTITVEKRGFFNDDAFFQDSWSEWDRAMRDAVDRWDKHTGKSTRTITSSHPLSEATSVYRNIRSSNVTSDESQAVSCVEEDERYKLVLDVKDFSPSAINVKAIDSTIVVEGKFERNEDGTISTQTFVRRFHLPPSVNMGGVSSALSRDGILTITAPKLERFLTHGESRRTVPIEQISPARYVGDFGTPKVKIIRNYPAGKPSDKDWGPFNPTGGGHITTYYRTRRL